MDDPRERAGAHFLLVGDSTDLATILDTVARLPVNAYGQIFIEVASDVQIQRWRVPLGMSVSWLRRDRLSSVVGTIAPRGELVARAVAAWVAEWMPEHHGDHELPYVLWIGCSASDRVDQLYRELAGRIDHLHLHHPHAD